MMEKTIYLERTADGVEISILFQRQKSSRRIYLKDFASRHEMEKEGIRIANEKLHSLTKSSGPATFSVQYL